jgi:sucrose-6-phosphate hydrolase SacC (GH32 family)
MNADSTPVSPAAPEAYRPAFHYSPHRNWMNDPNGLVWYDGEYHLFYQYNPLGTDWGNMSWGHAVSADLQTWEELPVAIPFSASEQVFSGSIVVDHADTSGLGSPDELAMVAVYTSVSQDSARQAQSLAYSIDRGRTWTHYEGNPVLDRDSSDFRDPKVFWYAEGNYWVMVVVLAAERVVQFYRSDNLLEWAHLSDFTTGELANGLWECPDVFELPVDGPGPERSRWVLLLSVNPGAPAGGSGTRYFVGDFDGKSFTADDDADDTWLDYGADCYAAVSFTDAPDGARVLIGWMNNWQYAGDTPTSSFRGSTTLPRACRLGHVAGRVRLLQQPIGPGNSMRELATRLEVRDLLVATGTTPLPETFHAAALEISVEFMVGSAERFGLHLRESPGQHTAVGYDTRSGSVFIDRTESGGADFHEAFPAVHQGPLFAEDGRVRLRIYVDTASIEVFGGRGECVLTDQIFPSSRGLACSLFAEGGHVTVAHLEVTHLRVASPRRPRA